jgi:hypothetical protein
MRLTPFPSGKGQALHLPLPLREGRVRVPGPHRYHPTTNHSAKRSIPRLALPREHRRLGLQFALHSSRKSSPEFGSARRSRARGVSIWFFDGIRAIRAAVAARHLAHHHPVRDHPAAVCDPALLARQILLDHPPADHRRVLRDRHLAAFATCRCHL